MRFGKIKEDTPVPLTHVILEEKKTGRYFHLKGKKNTHRYNTRSKFKHVTTFKNTPKMFKNYMAYTSTIHIGSDCIDKTYPKNRQSQWNQ